jgi:NTP pyrophosphatase (non-canonical NTP hydrolase)
MNIDLNKYSEFVEAVTSEQSNHTNIWMMRIAELERTARSEGVPLKLALLVTAGIGLSSEGGEFNEIVKKLLFQGKPYTQDIRYHLKRELGDVIWYWVNACRALGYDPNEVIAENVSKLESRYPGGSFDPYYSENRQAGDL